ncbi:glycoside hydrolase family 16 protein [Hyaloscypha variabilis F]|uniref:Glycoside hydrolase family 16 protein n=1 Tax=Hyaloscypha variabilis (strain UAMH 11265 / GT02V1 / F) TaxID=1149755 RepID=A0A2J6RSC2_HYAVF|nr:glycoside hydrolase family 16 protein [Hyaloscypha variabilis F]
MSIGPTNSTGLNSPIASFLDNSYVFTDLIETDAFHIKNIHDDTDWSIQNYNVSASSARGPYGMNFTGLNAVSNPIMNSSNWVGPPVSNGDPGIQLSVGGGVPGNGFVQVAQINSVRKDLLWGTFRALIKATPVPGTCTAFFWYFNDSQEIDFEALSYQYNFQNATYPLNLVLQSQQSARQGFSSAASGDWKVAYLPFDPTDDFHEYRIDFVPGNVVYYGDGQVLAIINTTAVPTSPGHLILSQWSNGDAGWSAGPPVQRAVSTVGYVKAYFNSSDPARQSAASKRCKDPSAPGAVCAISDQLISPGSLYSEFFSNNPNMTNNQTIYGKSDAPPFIDESGWTALLKFLAFLITAYVIERFV